MTASAGLGLQDCGQRAALSDNVGSFLYERLFDRHLDPLILVSAAFTALAFAFVPMLRLGEKRAGEPLRVGETSGS